MADFHAAAVAKYKEPGTKFTPPDIVFADSKGVVSDAATPKLLIGAVLCDRFTILRYIESGAFGQ